MFICAHCHTQRITTKPRTGVRFLENNALACECEGQYFGREKEGGFLFYFGVAKNKSHYPYPYSFLRNNNLNYRLPWGYPHKDS